MVWSESYYACMANVFTKAESGMMYNLLFRNKTKLSIIYDVLHGTTCTVALLYDLCEHRTVQIQSLLDFVLSLDQLSWLSVVWSKFGFSHSN